jgi:hypothetical protein
MSKNYLLVRNFQLDVEDDDMEQLYCSKKEKNRNKVLKFKMKAEKKKNQPYRNQD